MTGHALLIANCLICRRPFASNPVRVPSHPARRDEHGRLVPSTDPSDPREPICEPCIRLINAERRRLGQPEWPVADDAYDGVSEAEL